MSEQTRRQLIEAAAAIFSEQGYHRAKVEDVARRADVAKGTVYYHFSGKAELFAALVVEGIENHIRDIKNSVEADTPVEKQLKTLIKSSIELYLDYENVASITFSEINSSIDSEAFSLIEESKRKYLKFIQETVEEGIEKGEFKPLNPRLVASGLEGTLEGALEELFKEPPQNRPKREEITDTLVQLCLDGLLKD